MPENDLTEIWRPVVGFESWYSVSNLGRVRRDAPGPRTKCGFVLRPIANCSYVGVRLYFGDGDYKHCKIHQLVALTFIGPRPVRHEVNHKNGVKKDNRATNLEWVLHQENMLHAARSLMRFADRKGEAHHRATLSDKQVVEIRRRYETEKIRYSRLSRDFGVTTDVIGQIIRRTTWTHL